ncbi:MAG: hypothetical protein A4E56_02666 [Pelotomaculum sp. PtaU1.Bin065]|nr:MAG: hypothetical protein A4E56_02666 [Pelotomaculum sp. PtaU1.Bin065]
MNIKKYISILIVISLFTSLPVLTLLLHASSAEQSGVVQVGLLVGDRESEQGKLILSAYEQLLKEEGFPYQVVSPGDVAGFGGAGLQERFEALLVPEFVNSSMPPDVAEVINSYVREHGGQVLLVFDPATKDLGNTQDQAPRLANLAGVRYFMPAPGGQGSTYLGYWYFTSADKGREWGISPGKLEKDNAVSSYSYGKVQFEHSWAVNDDAQIVAYDSGEDFKNPVITEKSYESGGAAVYVNIPLGKCKLRSDDLTLRSVLRTFLIRYAKVPRLVNSPGGKGGMVFNLHICSGAYFRALMVMMMQGLFQKDVPLSIHITAGPDTYKLGDGAGFFAENKFKGKPVLEVLQNYGEIGSHGGWAHNFFAYNLQYMPVQKAVQLIKWNFDALEGVTGRKVREYSDPGGNHPLWIDSYIEGLGVNSYYHAGDSGSSLTHPRFDGKYAGQTMWAFPISPYREFACFEEMERGRVPSGEVKKWLADLVDFAAEERTIRMVYSHPSDTRFGLEAIRALEEKALAEQNNGRITIAPMSWFADFLNRNARTRLQVKKQESGNYIIALENPEGLEDVTVAVYVGDGREYVVRGGNVKSVQEEGWLYLTVTANRQKKHIEVRFD